MDSMNFLQNAHNILGTFSHPTCSIVANCEPFHYIHPNTPADKRTHEHKEEEEEEEEGSST
jgi:hypothetical protein